MTKTIALNQSDQSLIGAEGYLPAGCRIVKGKAVSPIASDAMMSSLIMLEDSDTFPIRERDDDWYKVTLVYQMLHSNSATHELNTLYAAVHQQLL